MTSSEKPLPFDEFPLFIPTKALSLLNPIHRTKILEIIPRGRKYQDDIKRPEQKNLQVLRILLGGKGGQLPRDIVMSPNITNEEIIKFFPDYTHILAGEINKLKALCSAMTELSFLNWYDMGIAIERLTHIEGIVNIKMMNMYLNSARTPYQASVVMDKIRQYGVVPHVSTLHAYMDKTDSFGGIPSCIAEMETLGLKPNIKTMNIYLSKAGSPEEAMQAIQEIKRRGLSPDIGTLQIASQWKLI